MPPLPSTTPPLKESILCCIPGLASNSLCSFSLALDNRYTAVNLQTYMVNLVFPSCKASISLRKKNKTERSHPSALKTGLKQIHCKFFNFHLSVYLSMWSLRHSLISSMSRTAYSLCHRMEKKQELAAVT